MIDMVCWWLKQARSKSSYWRAIMSRKRNAGGKRQKTPRRDDTFNGISCSIGGLECQLWFDEDGELHGRGPKEARAELETLLYRYTPLLKMKEVLEAVSELEPAGEAYLPPKKFAVLALMLEAEARGDRPEDMVLVKEQIEQRVKKLQELPNFD
jgi:hypothetical protein